MKAASSITGSLYFLNREPILSLAFRVLVRPSSSIFAFRALMLDSGAPVCIIQSLTHIWTLEPMGATPPKLSIVPETVGPWYHLTGAPTKGARCDATYKVLKVDVIGSIDVY